MVVVKIEVLVWASEEAQKLLVVLMLQLDCEQTRSRAHWSLVQQKEHRLTALCKLQRSKLWCQDDEQCKHIFTSSSKRPSSVSLGSCAVVLIDVKCMVCRRNTSIQRKGHLKIAQAQGQLTPVLRGKGSRVVNKGLSGLWLCKRLKSPTVDRHSSHDTSSIFLQFCHLHLYAIPLSPFSSPPASLFCLRRLMARRYFDNLTLSLRTSLAVLAFEFHLPVTFYDPPSSTTHSIAQNYDAPPVDHLPNRRRACKRPLQRLLFFRGVGLRNVHTPTVLARHFTQCVARANFSIKRSRLIQSTPTHHKHWFASHPAVLLNMVQGKKAADMSNGTSKPNMAFQRKDLSDFRGGNIGKNDERLQNGNVSSFRTDTAISGGRNQGERVLQRWVPDAAEDGDGSLESTRMRSAGGATWDQFGENERLFGLTTDYDENIYTTRIDKSHPQYKQRLAEAEKKAREIERSAANNSHVAEERITDNLAADENGLDEEDK
ncbi:hypothetical protein G7Y89_g15554 [Cudoniella acicularis]|uniref:LsmAD domain-containing protein n=1 Tax=Cudoniella acicularis TaxID=354080 RepID=A0A8H4QL04_9HELO|nr:hypothetical protein G7Y89_g15554 [Cudoniella acicularis]